MRRLGHLCRAVLCTLPLLGGSVQAQVDWSELLGEKGARPVETPRVMPQHEDASPPTSQPQELRRPQAPVAKKARANREPVRPVRPPRAVRKTSQHSPEEEREYPTVRTQRRR